MAVLEHEVHEKVKIDSSFRYGCHNREKYFDTFVAHPWAATGGHEQEYRMSRDCRFDMSLRDPACDGCEHRGSGERYNEMVRSQGT